MMRWLLALALLLAAPSVEARSSAYQSYNVAGRSAQWQGFSPTWIVGLKGWWTSAAGITVATGVSNWVDQSGNGNTMVQATGANQPTFSTADANWKGARSLTFAAGQFLAAADSSSLKITGALTISAAIRSSTESAALNTLISKGVTSCEWDAYTDNFTTNLIRTSSSQGIVTSGAANNVNTSYILTTDQAAKQAFYFNGVPQTIGTNLFGAGTVSTNVVRIGERQDGSTQLTGSAVEFMVINRYLDAGEVARLHAYQSSRWGLP